MGENDEPRMATENSNSVPTPRVAGQKDMMEVLPEVGGILHLDHLNFQVADHDLATVFFINGLGLTRDPYRRADETNMGINAGLQQFHLPRRGPTPPLPGTIGMVVPDLAAIRTRLTRLEHLGKFDGTGYTAGFDTDIAEITSPFGGVRLRLHASGTVPFLRSLGISYVEIFVPAGTSEAIAKFYATVFHATTTRETNDGAATTIVNAGPYQTVRFIERDVDSHDTHTFHLSYHVTHYNQVRDRIAAAGALKGQGTGQVFFFDRIFDPDTGATVLELVNEVRSVYHRDFMRPLVNRWPIIDEPFSDQTDVMAGLEREVGFMPGEE
jgi:predicted enzyme related to lactoylglutathione lyase